MYNVYNAWQTFNFWQNFVINIDVYFEEVVSRIDRKFQLALLNLFLSSKPPTLEITSSHFRYSMDNSRIIGTNKSWICEKRKKRENSDKIKIINIYIFVSIFRIFQHKKLTFFGDYITVCPVQFTARFTFYYRLLLSASSS